MSLHFGPAAARKNLQHCEFEFLITHRCSLMTTSGFWNSMFQYFGPAAARKNLQHCEFEFLITHRCSLMTTSGFWNSMFQYFGPAAARNNLQHCEFEFLITHRCSLTTISVEQHVPMTAQSHFWCFGRVFQVELPKERKKTRRCGG